MLVTPLVRPNKRVSSDEPFVLHPFLRATRHPVLGSKAGFTAIVSAAFGPDRLLYELELSDAP